MDMYFLFVDNETGEEFYVDASSMKDAIATAEEFFNDPEFIRVDDEFEVEMNGLDIY